MNRLFSIAVRNVGRNRRRSVITGLSILFGVAMIILVRGFTWGLSELMIADVVDGRTGAIQVHKRGFVDNIEAVPTRLNLADTAALRDTLRSTPHVVAVAGRIQFGGLVSNGLAQTMFVGRGLDLETESQTCPKASSQVTEGGRPLQVGDTNSVLVGYELAQAFKSQVGTNLNVQATSPSGRSNAIDLTVRGMTISTFPYENKRVVTVPLATAQSLLGLEGRVTEFAVRIDDLSTLDSTAEALRAKLGPEYEVHTWRELQPFVRDLINRQNFVLGAIGLVLFVIVLTSIVNTMLMSVFERVREIGTMLAVGVRRRQVMLMFIYEALVLGVLGGIAGALLGRLMLLVASARGINISLSGVSGQNILRPHTTPQFILVTVAVAIVGAVLAALWPAFRASRLNPVDALRSA